MSTNKVDPTVQTPSIETLDEKYDLDKQLGGYLDSTKLLVGETVGTVGLNIANEQIKAFLTEYIPSIIINVSNIHGTMIAGKLLSQIQMTLFTGFTGGLGFDSLLDTVAKVVSLGSYAMLGLSDDVAKAGQICSLLQDPMAGYAKLLGYSAYIPKAVSWIPFSGSLGTTAGKVDNMMKLPSKVYNGARDIYLTPFTLFSDWMADNTAQLVIIELRDPFLQDTFIPALQDYVDNLLPKRNIECNFDPLETQEEHAYDIVNKKLSGTLAQYSEFKNNSNVMLHFMLSLGEVLGEELLNNPKLQDLLVEQIAGKSGKKVLDVTRTAYSIKNDKNALSNTIAGWMQENFEFLAQIGSEGDLPNLKKHADLFKKAFSGKILTKYELDTIKGKWELTKLIEGAMIGTYNIVKSYMVKDGRESYQNLKDEIKKAIVVKDVTALDNFLNNNDASQKYVNRNIILKNQRLGFRSEDKGRLPVSPLLYVIETGDFELFKLLVENCHIQDIKNGVERSLIIDLDQYSAGITPLQRAIMKGHNDIALYLIKSGVNLVKPSIIGNATALMIAAKTGNLELLTILLKYEQVSEAIDAKAFRGRTALHYAMMNGNLKIAEQLIENGADLFLKDATGNTPIGILYNKLLIEATGSNLTKVEMEQKFEQLLQELKPALTKKVKDNKYPLDRDYLCFAISLGCVLSTNPDKPWFNTLFEHNEIKLISKLMHNHPSSNIILDEMWNAVNGDKDKAVLILGDALSKPNASQIASKLIDIEFTRDIDIITDCLKGVLHKQNKPSFPFLGFDTLNQSVLNSIIQRKDINLLDQNVLMHMLNHQIKNGQLDSVKRIVKLNPNLLNKQDELGNTPLHYALKYGRYEITQELLKEGAVVYIENNSGDTAYKNWTNDNTGIINFIKNIGKNKGLSDKEVLAKAVALKVVQITEQIQVLEENILNTPMERYNIIYKSLSTLIQQDINDEIRNEVITKILKRSDSDMEIYIINKGSKEGLILQALLKKDYKLLDVILKNLLEKSPEDREDIYKFFVNELLTAASEKDIIMGLEVILNLPDDDKNALLSLKHKGQPLPSEIAFKNKHYKVMEHILNLSPKNVSLEMMDYILKNKLPCAKKVFDENQELIAKSIMNEENKTAIRYLTYIWHRPSSNDFDLQLFKTYFLNASGEVINLFLTGNNNKGFIYNYQITIEELVKKLNDDELATFIDTKLEFLSDSLKMSLLALEITKGNIKNIRKIINANPNLLILQLPEHNNNTPLHMAINKKEWPIACYFMSKDCLVNLENNSKHTAFNDWVAAGNKTKSDDAAFELILETGSPSEIQSATSRISGTILIMMHFHKQEVEKLLQKANQPEEKIKIIVDRIQMILHPSHNLSNKGMMTEEAYLNATKDIIVELAKDLTTLEDIFSYKLPNTKGNTLLHQAISTKNTILTEFILNYFGTHDLLNDEGNTPLHLAIINKDPNLNKMLIENEALVNIQNGEGNTLLHLTIINKDLPLTTMLLEKVESLDIQNSEGNTLLHLAIKNDDPVLTEMLIKQGASVDLKNKEGKTASDLIESAGQSKAYGLGIFKPVSLIGAKSVEFKALIELQRSKVDSDALPGPDNHEESNTLAMGPPK